MRVSGAARRLTDLARSAEPAREARPGCCHVSREARAVLHGFPRGAQGEEGGADESGSLERLGVGGARVGPEGRSHGGSEYGHDRAGRAAAEISRQEPGEGRPSQDQRQRDEDVEGLRGPIPERLLPSSCDQGGQGQKQRVPHAVRGDRIPFRPVHHEEHAAGDADLTEFGHRNARIEHLLLVTDQAEEALVDCPGQDEGHEDERGGERPARDTLPKGHLHDAPGFPPRLLHPVNYDRPGPDGLWPEHAAGGPEHGKEPKRLLGVVDSDEERAGGGGPHRHCHRRE